ncbi:MAG: response regulator [Planctomycetota bacterium]|nr:response regulator [Planctomycetota bacterium]
MSPRPEPIVHVVDDDSDMRESLTYLLQSVGLQVRVYRDGTEFRAGYRDDHPGCLLFDVRMPETSGLELYEQLVADGVRSPVIFMTAFADVPMAVRALKSGAVEFLEKPFNRQDLLDRVQHAVAVDIERYDRGLQWDLVGRRLDELTAREREVLDMVLAGFPNKTIAARLELSERAVELRRASLMRKMQVTATVELIRLITQYQLISESRMSRKMKESSGSLRRSNLPDR